MPRFCETRRRASRRLLLQARDDEAVVIVEDDGRGFDVAQEPERSENHGLGLVSMRERAVAARSSINCKSRNIDYAPVAQLSSADGYL